MDLRTRICLEAVRSGRCVALPEAATSAVVFDAAESYVKLGGRVAFVDSESLRHRVADSQLESWVERLVWIPPQDDPILAGLDAIEDGMVDSMVAGVTTSSAHVLSSTLRRVVSDGSWLAQGALLVYPSGRTFLVADCAAIPEPSAEQVASMGVEMASVFGQLTGQEPVVALISYVTASNVPGTPAKMRKAAQLLHASHPDLPADGPVQLDAAVDSRIARIKGLAGPVGGDANVLLFPCLDAANNILKLSQHVAGADLVCVVSTGLTHPVVNLSRGALTPEVLGTVGAAAVLAT